MKDKKEQVGIGIVFVTIVILTLFLWSPVYYYLGKWSEYWDEISFVEPMIIEPVKKDLSTYNKAQDDCEKRAKAYFKVPDGEFLSYASSTDDRKYKEYKCYGIKWTELK